jgi:hypothetical protein
MRARLDRAAASAINDIKTPVAVKAPAKRRKKRAVIASPDPASEHAAPLSPCAADDVYTHPNSRPFAWLPASFGQHMTLHHHLFWVWSAPADGLCGSGFSKDRAAA